MGLILDSSVLITAEREGQNARQMLAAISGKAGNTDTWRDRRRPTAHGV